MKNLKILKICKVLKIWEHPDTLEICDILRCYFTLGKRGDLGKVCRFLKIKVIDGKRYQDEY